MLEGWLIFAVLVLDGAPERGWSPLVFPVRTLSCRVEWCVLIGQGLVSTPSEAEGADSGQSQWCSRLERSFGCEGQVVKVLQVVKGRPCTCHLNSASMAVIERQFYIYHPCFVYFGPLLRGLVVSF